MLLEWEGGGGGVNNSVYPSNKHIPRARGWRYWIMGGVGVVIYAQKSDQGHQTASQTRY